MLILIKVSGLLGVELAMFLLALSDSEAISRVLLSLNSSAVISFTGFNVLSIITHLD